MPLRYEVIYWNLPGAQANILVAYAWMRCVLHENSGQICITGRHSECILIDQRGWSIRSGAWSSLKGESGGDFSSVAQPAVSGSPAQVGYYKY